MNDEHDHQNATETAIHRFVAACRAGTHEPMVTRLATGWLVLGEIQVLPGYCLVLPDPVVPHMNALAPSARLALWEDVTRVGDALLQLTDAVRINYEILGNLEPALHVHLFPRYDHEPEALRTKPVWNHDWDAAPRFQAQRDGSFISRLAATLQPAIP